MKNKSSAITLKAVALFLSWLTLSPLMLILDGRWKLLPKWLRIVLFVLSPMLLLLVAAAAFRSYICYSEHYVQHHFIKRRVIENITGVRLPKYKVVNRGETWRCFGIVPNHSCDFTLEFKRMPDDAFYEKLDEHFDRFELGKYSYSAIWGNGIEAPKGVSEKHDGTFRVEIEKGSKAFYIEAGTW